MDDIKKEDEEVAEASGEAPKGKEAVYITRDEDSVLIIIWRKPPKGVWSPQKMTDCDMVNWQRSDHNVEYMDIYTVPDFKKKFGITIKEKTKKYVHLDHDLLYSNEGLMMTPIERLESYGRVSKKHVRSKLDKQESGDTVDEQDRDMQ